jgi:alkanesulfonate monooxygenase SsuD/methylene tetrahydromethanopterin reductase-like flavin-dependent oxidoreductase (luciferase family)
MQFGFVFPASDPLKAIEYALVAELAGWDGFFVYESVWSTDPWVTLSHIAACTERLRLGTMLTPLPVLIPWKLAAETATLDALSNGRVILAVGLGAPDSGFANFGLPIDRRVRAERLDEGLEIVNGLWAGQPFSFQGKHYSLKETQFNPPPSPIQTRNGVPHIPIWVVGAWFREKSMRRVIKYDGLLPNTIGESGHRPTTPDDVREMKAWVDANRAGDAPFDIIVEGQTPAKDPAKQTEFVGPYIEAGATWWIESMWDKGLKQVLARLKQGPPKF